MNSLLFISNGNKPTDEEYNYIGEEKLTNFSIPVILAAKKMGFDITIGINRKYAKKMTCEYPVRFYNAEIYRNPFKIQEVTRAYKNALTELKSKNYYAIHCNTPIGGVIGRLAGHKCRINKVIYTAHGFHFYKGAPFLNWILYYPIERFLAHYTDAIVTINREDYYRAQKFKLKKNGKVYYVPGVGIDINSFKKNNDERIKTRTSLEIRDNDVFMISVGDLNNNKNNKVIINAMSKLNDRKLHYFLCGDGPLKCKLQKMVIKKGLEDNVHFLGFRNDIPQLLNAADIFVMPSLREGLSRSLMEAMGTGLPCIVSNIRGNTDLIGENKGGFLCKPHSVEEFSKAIDFMAKNEDIRKQMGSTNRERITCFSDEAARKAISDVYAELFG